MVPVRCHTPFCARNCRLRHHNLVTTLCLENDHSKNQEETSNLLKECLDTFTVIGWDRNSEVPDPSLADLCSPILFLASAFGKAHVVEALLKENFTPSVLNRNGETPLHGAVRHIYRTGSLYSHGFKVAAGLGPVKNRERVFKRIMLALTEKDPMMFFVQDNENNTVFHVAAEKIRGGRIGSFYDFCLTEMIQRLSELEDLHVLSRDEVLDGLNMKNKGGDTVLHIMARESNYGFKSLKLVLDTFFRGNLPSVKNNENQTFSNIALECGEGKALEMFPEFQEQGEMEATLDSATNNRESVRDTACDPDHMTSGSIDHQSTSSTSTVEKVIAFFENTDSSKAADVKVSPTDIPIDAELLLVDDEEIVNDDTAKEPAQTEETGAFENHLIIKPRYNKEIKEISVADAVTSAQDATVLDSINPKVFEVPCNNIFSNANEVQVMYATEVVLSQNNTAQDCFSKGSMKTEMSGTSENNTHEKEPDAEELCINVSPQNDFCGDKTCDRSSGELDSFAPSEEKGVASHSSTHVTIEACASAADSNVSNPDKSENDFFLDFLVNEGLNVDSIGKQNIVAVILAQHASKLQQVENVIPKLSEDIKGSEAALGSQKEKVKCLEEELSLEKKIVAEREDSLQCLRSEQMSLCEEMMAMKRKVAYCENTITKLQGSTKKIRSE